MINPQNENNSYNSSNLTGSSATGNDNSNVISAGNEYQALDDYIEKMRIQYENYEQLRSHLQKRKVFSDILNSSLLYKVSGMGKFINPYLDLNESNYSDALTKRDKYFELYNDAKAKKVELLTNIAAQKNRYLYEREALKNVGVNNPFFMLKNGVLGSFSTPSLTGGTFASNNGNTDSLKFKRGSLLKDFKELLSIIKMIKDIKN